LLIWVFVPYSIRQGLLDGYDYDTMESKRELAEAFRALNLAWMWQPIVKENLDDIIQQVSETESIVINFCDGLDGDGMPGLNVVKSLERAGIRFTGADSEFFEVSTSKLRMKKMLEGAGVPTPAFEELPAGENVHGVCARVGTPLLVKPDASASSGGIHLRSKVSADADAAAMRDALSREPAPFFCDTRRVFAERFIEGLEFTVFVVGDWRDPDAIRWLPPAERIFNATLPDHEKFLTYDRYWGFFSEESAPTDGLPYYDLAACDPRMAPRLADLAARAYTAVHGTGYARVDIRMDRETHELFVLEVNANCGVSEDDPTSGVIFKLAGMSFANVISMILEQATATRSIGAAS
jgi:D-alanine-D-alanine ligase